MIVSAKYGDGMDGLGANCRSTYAMSECARSSCHRPTATCVFMFALFQKTYISGSPSTEKILQEHDIC